MQEQASIEQVDPDVVVKEFVGHFHEHGYVVLPQQYAPELLSGWQRLLDRMVNEHKTGDTEQTWFGNMAERAPDEMLPAVTNANVLDLLEAVMGPFVQLDNLTLAAFPPVNGKEDTPAVSGWHRDRWAGVPRGEAFQRPLAANAVCYLQDLDEELGPLRVLPGSHRRAVTLSKERRSLPHPEEKLLYAKADDVIVTHNGLVHSGTPNRSDRPRYFFSIYYNMSWLRTTDDHGGPNVGRLIAEARERNDHRTMRLFGVDDNLQIRGNSGFLRPDEESWAAWAAEDRAALASTPA